MTNDDGITRLKERIKELNDKATQMLLFLSFAIVGAATVNADKLPAPAAAAHVRLAISWWVRAVFPVLFGVLPLKDFWWSKLRWSQHGWFSFLLWAKVVFLWAAVLLSAWGAVHFLRAVIDP
jgi:hypothetical protein